MSVRPPHLPPLPPPPPSSFNLASFPPLKSLMLVLGFLYLRASLVVQRLKRLPAMWETWVQSLEREDPEGGHGNPLQYSFLENAHG